MTSHSRVHELYGDQVNIAESVKTICSKAHRYGLDDKVLVASHDQECEREVQQEKEQHQEEVLQQKNCTARQEIPWEYRKVLLAQTATDVNNKIILIELGEFVRKNMRPTDCSKVLWSAAKVYGTCNFFTTVVTPMGCGAANEFTRKIDAMLLFLDGSVLLLSECEADHILGLLWTTTRALQVSWRLVNLPNVLDAIDDYGERVLANYVPRSVGVNSPLLLFPLVTAAACCLFNGQVNFGKRPLQAFDAALKHLLQPLRQREITLQEFVALRGYSQTWSRSALHELCHKMDQSERR